MFFLSFFAQFSFSKTKKGKRKCNYIRSLIRSHSFSKKGLINERSKRKSLVCLLFFQKEKKGKKEKMRLFQFFAVFSFYLKKLRRGEAGN